MRGEDAVVFRLVRFFFSSRQPMSPVSCEDGMHENHDWSDPVSAAGGLSSKNWLAAYVEAAVFTRFY